MNLSTQVTRAPRTPRVPTHDWFALVASFAGIAACSGGGGSAERTQSSKAADTAGCDPNACEVPSADGTSCVSECSGCTTCNNGTCSYACDTNNCETCQGDSCQSNCGPESSCNGSGVCEASCDFNSCMEPINGGCQSFCSSGTSCNGSGGCVSGGNPDPGQPGGPPNPPNGPCPGNQCQCADNSCAPCGECG